MTVISQDAELLGLLNAARQEANTPLSRDQVADIVRGVLDSLDGDLSAVNLKVFGELDALAGYITAMRNELSVLRPHDISAEHIPNATDQLDAVIGATEAATGEIMDAAETVEKVAAGLDADNAQALQDAVTRVYEACSFQDITGQRITKVVTALKHIEFTIAGLLEVFGDEIGPLSDAAKTGNAGDVDPGEVLDGPALGGPAMDQDAIDRLLAGLD